MGLESLEPKRVQNLMLKVKKNSFSSQIRAGEKDAYNPANKRNKNFLLKAGRGGIEPKKR
jgi:hypothetical protein